MAATDEGVDTRLFEEVARHGSHRIQRWDLVLFGIRAWIAYFLRNTIAVPLPDGGGQRVSMATRSREGYFLAQAGEFLHGLGIDAHAGLRAALKRVEAAHATTPHGWVKGHKGVDRASAALLSCLFAGPLQRSARHLDVVGHLLRTGALTDKDVERELYVRSYGTEEGFEEVFRPDRLFVVYSAPRVGGSASPPRSRALRARITRHTTKRRQPTGGLLEVLYARGMIKDPSELTVEQRMLFRRWLVREYLPAVVDEWQAKRAAKKSGGAGARANVDDRDMD